MKNISSLYIMIFSEILIFFLVFFLRKQKKGQIKTCFSLLLFFMFIWTFSLILQICFQSYNINPIFFEKLAVFGATLLPVALFILSIIFTKTKLVFKWYYPLLLIVPLFSILIMWSDQYTLMYSNYSIYTAHTIHGPYFYIHATYTYTLLGISIFLLLKYSIKNAGFFSKQSLLIVLGVAIPIVANMLGTFSIIPMTVYVTPICFAFTILFFALAIFKFNFLSVTPIAMQRIVDRMSDSFIVINEENKVTDFNQTFLTTFDMSSNEVRNVPFIEIIKDSHFAESDIKNMFDILEKCKTTTNTYQFKRNFKIDDKYFNIEASGIFSKNTFLGTLVLLKDVTQHIIDMHTIEDNQSMLMEKERLASLGQMIGGIAHNLKTPIMSISGAAEGLKDLTKEYDISIGDPTVTNDDHHEIVKDMNEWIEKIKTHTSYMSDVITAVKGQAVAFSDATTETFTVSELLTHIDVLMKHELKNALIELKTSVLVPKEMAIKGNINSLVQVINNIISNAIQAYGGQTNKNIDFTIKSSENNIIFSIQDYGCGMPKKVQDKLFKEMITTKGKNGTGLGLFMSFSNIRAHFNGDMTFKSKEGKGTTFDITIPLN